MLKNAPVHVHYPLTEGQIVLRTEPSCATFRWRLELRPVIENPRALTLATGCAEQAVPPEEVAAFLRGL